MLGDTPHYNCDWTAETAEIGSDPDRRRCCTFWMIEALAVLGRPDEALEAMKQAVLSIGVLGLMAEDYDVAARRMWGNFPQTYSHVGLIHAAFAASPAWSELL